jgi:purine catabolism regulator
MLTVAGLVADLGLELASGHEAAGVSVRWVHSTELPDPTQWLRGRAAAHDRAAAQRGTGQREPIERLADRGIAGLGFDGLHAQAAAGGAGVAARGRGFPLFEVPYELPFIAITERVFASAAGRALRNAAAQHGRGRSSRRR